ncbi:hypothetical protein KUTeg_005374 [Tegillarca granosa]|uniref:V-type proton ATPase subunit n=1 Tax=Tegillarca granosa TaxID=220873 RepID=A0ABQ9FMH3_TEGGR|nr:hypothetical protein KUTeg_005374 [Tegillarca granosa]
MDRKIIPAVAMTSIWGFVGIVAPIFVQFCMRGSPNKGVVQVMLVLTAACCWLFWLCAWMFQLNPLIGPSLETNFIRYIQEEWK